MKNLEEILASIANADDCTALRTEAPIVLKIEYSLPSDLRYYLQNYERIELFKTSEYPIIIVGASEFRRANPVIVGDDIEDDISHNWFIIATDNKSQYITIDLAKERLGKCYDSFLDRHGVVGEQPIVANSFTDLLQALYDNKGDYFYWLKDDFKSLGDAYDSI